MTKEISHKIIAMIGAAVFCLVTVITFAVLWSGTFQTTTDNSEVIATFDSNQLKAKAEQLLLDNDTNAAMPVESPDPSLIGKENPFE